MDWWKESETFLSGLCQDICFTWRDVQSDWAYEWVQGADTGKWQWALFFFVLFYEGYLLYVSGQAWEGWRLCKESLWLCTFGGWWIARIQVWAFVRYDKDVGLVQYILLCTGYTCQWWNYRKAHKARLQESSGTYIYLRIRQ